MPDEWEYGFYDSEEPGTIWWYCFGLPFTSAEQADHTGRKSTWWHPVIVRRRPGSAEWEPVQETDEPTPVRCDYCGDLLPAVKERAHIPTTPDLQRLGFAAGNVVCPECVMKQRSGDPS